MLSTLQMSSLYIKSKCNQTADQVVSIRINLCDFDDNNMGLVVVQFSCSCSRMQTGCRLMLWGKTAHRVACTLVTYQTSLNIFCVFSLTLSCCACILMRCMLKFHLFIHQTPSRTGPFVTFHFSREPNMLLLKLPKCDVYC